MINQCFKIVLCPQPQHTSPKKIHLGESTAQRRKKIKKEVTIDKMPPNFIDYFNLSFVL